MCSIFFFFKQKTAYEMRISDWSSDVCSSDLPSRIGGLRLPGSVRYLFYLNKYNFLRHKTLAFRGWRSAPDVTLRFQMSTDILIMSTLLPAAPSGRERSEWRTEQVKASRKLHELIAKAAPGVAPGRPEASGVGKECDRTCR